MSKRKLLLADDSVTIQKVVNLTFADEGIEVISVGDGDTAMDKVAEISPDLIMADVNMPGLNGYQICEQIRQTEAFRQTPVILLVGSFEPFDEEEARRVGADDFLTKPFQSIRQLVNKVTVLLNSENTERTEVIESAKVPNMDDTLKMEYNFAEIPIAEPARFDNSEFDDEMIQTSQFSGYSLDESQKFETRNPPVIKEEDFSRTQPLTREEINEFGLVESSGQNLEETGEEITEIAAQETLEELQSEYYEPLAETETETEEPIKEVSYELEETSGAVETPVIEAWSPITEIPEAESIETETPTEEVSEDRMTPEDEMPLPEVASVLESDEDDLLELPPIESDFDDDEEEVSTPTEVEEVTQTEDVPATGSSDQISPDLIEAIANRVMEKLSEKAVKEVAWEVVPQMTELIVKKMAEEKLKE